MLREPGLRELWFHTGTACNLNCAFCLEGSSPGDTRLERVRLEDLRPYFDTAGRLGVERFAFTGGEPLIVKDIVRILEYALSLRPCLVLTNGTAPLIKRVHQLDLLRRQTHPLSFRVSIDFPDEARHDAGRGLGNFRKAFAGLRLLYERGFAVSVARQMESAPEDEARTEAIEGQFRAWFRKHGLPETTLITALPDFGALGAEPRPAPDPEPETATGSGDFLCTYSRMVMKRDGRMRVHACALTDDDLRFDLGEDLAAAVDRPIERLHRRCESCKRLSQPFGTCTVV